MKVLVSCLVVLLPLLRASSVSIYDDLQNEIGNSDNTAHSRESRATKLEKWCIASGDPHFITFDNENYDFQGMCKYLLAGISPEEMDYEPFSIYAKHVPWSSNLLTSYVHYVEIHVYGYIIKMGQQKRVWIDGVVQQPRCPISLDGNNIRIEFQQNFVHLTTDFGLRVKYDGEWIAYVYVPEDLRTQGLCGNNDGVGNYTNLLQWQVDDPAESKCRVIDPPSECTQEQRDVIMVDRYCGHLFKFSSSDCSNETLLEALQENCVYDVCAVFPNVIEMQEVSCHHLESFPQACNGAFLPETWRKDTTCVMECPGDLVYNARGSMCPDTCQRPFASQDCPEEIGETCECPGDTVIGPGNTCLTPLQCVCGTSPGNQGSTAIGGFFLDDDCKTKYTCKFCDENNINNGNHNETKCQFGYAQLQQEDHWCRPTEFCNRNVCEERDECHSFADVHYISFDGTEFHFQGACKYDLVMKSGNMNTIPNFRLLTRNEHLNYNTRVSWTRYVELQLNGHILRIDRADAERRDMVLIIDGTVVPFKKMTTLHGQVTIRPNGWGIVRVETKFGLGFDFSTSEMDLKVYIPKSMQNQVSGLCGRYDGDSSNDLIDRNGVDQSGDASLEVAFGNSWQVNDPENQQCQPANVIITSSCPEPTQTLVHTEGFCGLISNPGKSPFNECFKILTVRRQNFGAMCEFDVCAFHHNLTAMKGAACAMLSSLAGKCRDLGIVVDWREAADCPLMCPEGQEYQVSGSPCINTCDSPMATDFCLLPSVETCACPGEMVLDNGICIDVTYCKCAVDGTIREIGESWLSDNCDRIYYCNNFGRRKLAAAVATSHSHACHEIYVCEHGSCKEFSKCRAGFDIHVHTFDQERFSYHGLCKYNLASFDGSADIPAFRVLVKTERRNYEKDVSYPKYFELQVYNEVLRLSSTFAKDYSNILLVNNRLRDLGDGTKMSLADGRITIIRDGSVLIVTTNFGLKVDWHGDRWGGVYIPRQWNGIMSGMCGNNNGDIADDLVAKNGTDMRRIPYGASHLGISWHVDDPEEPNCVSTIDAEISICESEDEIGQVNRNDTRCGLISTWNSPFRECLLSMGDAEGFQTDCRFDVCANILNDTAAHDEACAHLEMLFNECQLAGFLVDWRDRAECPMDCRGGSEYRLNASPCIDKCGDPIASQQCALPKTEGCVCPDQKLFKDGVCVSSDECGCVDETGVEHKMETQWMSHGCTQLNYCYECRNCTGGPGIIRRWSGRCSRSAFCNSDGACEGLARCQVGTDPHFVTFDRKFFDFQGVCKYQLARSAADADTTPPFEVYVKTELRYLNYPVSYPKYFEVHVYGHVIRLMKYYRVLVDGVEVNVMNGLTLDGGKLKIDRFAWCYIRVTTDFGLRVEFTYQNVGYVYVPYDLKDATSGLCGNFNYDRRDDLVAKNGTDMSTVTDGVSHFGNSWQVQDPEDSECEGRIDSKVRVCNNEERRIINNNSYCGLLLNRHGSPFEECLAVLGTEDARNFGLNCFFDVCTNIDNLDDAHDVACGSLRAVAIECEMEEILVDWREAAGCVSEAYCTGGTVPVPQGSACPNTCKRPLASESCEMANTEACECPDGQVLQDGNCVDLDCALRGHYAEFG
ncbi:hypothetical protein CAPTEDRAFT_201172 [Capitella teleta]|uniref:VWFD domain-containing protein n=1 Tax=Capitella teleta TaxID=283909 RepID=R7VHI9_CAPTE|nr:hypothetical protein CAPTEDRAFT_201172 [Capitella teleta]|eukprot:ELU15751.1 hypothetical protein CAPTEDRAFT_201172 [Capitella teleta]